MSFGLGMARIALVVHIMMPQGQTGFSRSEARHMLVAGGGRLRLVGLGRSRKAPPRVEGSGPGRIAVTTLASWTVVLTLALGATTLLALRGRAHDVPGLWLALVGNQLSMTLLKLAFARPRSDLAICVESTFSFPNGHAASGTVFYWVVTCVMIRERAGPTLLSLVVGIGLVLLVGLSRLSLGEHYLSDVLNGFLVGGFWAILGAFLMEYLSTRVRGG